MPTIFLIAVTFISFSSCVSARPWYLDEVSSELMKMALDMRNANVPESEASSIAEQIIDGAIAPPQVTPLAQDMADMIIGGGGNINPVKALELVVQANRAYGAVRKSQGFGNFLHYVSFQASKFDTKAIENIGREPAKHGSTLQTLIQNALIKLSEDAQGRQAISGARQLANTIAQDAGVHIHF